jgi:hypothetical protein
LNISCKTASSKKDAVKPYSKTILHEIFPVHPPMGNFFKEFKIMTGNFRNNIAPKSKTCHTFMKFSPDSLNICMAG